LVFLTEALGDLVDIFLELPGVTAPPVTWTVVNISTRRRRTDVVVAKIDFMIGTDNKYLERMRSSRDSNE
jgi:hypothetical protein